MHKNSPLLSSLVQIPNKARIWIYGAGTHGCMFFSSIKYFRPDIVVQGFIDSSKKGYILNYDKGFFDNSIRSACKNLPVIHLAELNKEDKYDLIIIATNPLFWSEIEENIKSNNFNKYLINAFFDFDIFGKKRKNKIQEYSRQSLQVENIFDDIYDRNTWNVILKSMKNSNIIDSLTYCTGKHSKQYNEVITLRKGDIVINGGAVSGIDTKIFPEQVGDEGCIYAFDPRFKDEHINVGKLSNVVQVPLALYDVNKQLYFVDTAGNTLVSKTKRANASDIDAISIDEFVNENNIRRLDLIKLDIEGSEPEAIKGGQKSINKFRPQLAIAIYHKLEQFFEIPLYLSKLLTDYRFYVRFYDPYCTDVILYAIPLEKMD